MTRRLAGTGLIGHRHLDQFLAHPELAGVIGARAARAILAAALEIVPVPGQWEAAA